MVQLNECGIAKCLIFAVPISSVVFHRTVLYQKRTVKMSGLTHPFSVVFLSDSMSRLPITVGSIWLPLNLSRLAPSLRAFSSFWAFSRFAKGLIISFYSYIKKKRESYSFQHFTIVHLLVLIHIRTLIFCRSSASVRMAAPLRRPSVFFLCPPLNLLYPPLNLLCPPLNIL